MPMQFVIRQTKLINLVMLHLVTTKEILGEKGTVIKSVLWNVSNMNIKNSNTETIIQIFYQKRKFIVETIKSVYLWKLYDIF